MNPYLLSSLGALALCAGWLLREESSGYGPSAFGAKETVLMVDTCFADTLICRGDTLRIGGEAITTPGTYTLTSALPPGCESVLVLNVLQRNNIEVQLDIELCHGENARFGVYTFGRTGYYEIRLPGRNGCDTLIFLDLLVSDLGTPRFQTEPDDGSGNGAVDLSISGEDLFFRWSNGAATEDIEGLPAGDYQVTITNADSCRAVRTVTVPRLEQFAAPNAFTPNGDGVNDFFNLVGGEAPPRILAFRIYNRWGQLVYDNGAPEQGWDGTFKGTPQAADTYFYFIQVERSIGPEEVLTYQGDVLLLR